MNFDFLKNVVRSATNTTQIALVSLCLLAFWLGIQFDLGKAVVGTGDTMQFEVSRTEILLILVLLFLNVLIAYTLFRQFAKTNRIMKMSTSVIIVTFLVICIWLVRVFQVQTLAVDSTQLVSGSANRFEVILLLLLIFGSIFATLAQFKRFRKSKDVLVMSSYSKQVKYEGEWISIEDFLSKELGLKVSHGVTPEEKERALSEFRKALASQNE